MATTKVTNSFINGINKDLAISKSSNQTLTFGLDINIVTINGESTGVITNHLGNTLSFNIPDTYPIYSIKLDGNTGSPIMSINGIGPAVLSITNQSTVESVYDDLVAIYSTYINAGQYTILHNNKEVLVIGYTLDPTVLISSGNGLTVSTLVPAQTDLSIIGWTTLRDDIILFTTSKTNTNSDPIGNSLSYYGQVWRVQYDKSTNTVISPNGGNLNSQDHLIYNNLTQFSLSNEIEREAIGMVENSIKGNVYWTDNYNRPRVINIYNSNSLAIPIELLDWKPSNTMSTPLVLGLLDGGNTKVGKYQFAYQLYTKDGAVTPFSPLSFLYDATDDLISNAFMDYDGADSGETAGKSFKIRIPDIDINYDFIKVAVVLFEQKDQAQAFSFGDIPITDTSMDILFTGNEVLEVITLAELVNPLISFDTCKTFTQKKNRLYPANTTTTKFDVDWDARAYRFDSNPECVVYSRNGDYKVIDSSTWKITSINGSSITPIDIDDTEDVVNPYNDESGQVYGLYPLQDYDTTGTNWLTDYQYKYQSDGTTIGGEGPNVSYEFFVKTYQGDLDVTDIPALSPFVDVYQRNNAGTTQSIYSPSTGVEPFIEGLDSIKNPMYSALFPSYARGEVYRFGITFYNIKGEESFVKWIGDIRIPEPWEDNLFDLTNRDSGDTIELQAIGIDFTVDTSSLPSDITGFRFVRVKRKDTDKTRYGTGLTIGAWQHDLKLAQSGSTPAWYLMQKSVYSFFKPTEANLHLNINSDFRNTETTTLGIIKFPEFDFDKYTNGESSHIKRISNYNITNTNISLDTVSAVYNLPDLSVPGYENIYNSIAVDVGAYVDPTGGSWPSGQPTFNWMHAIMHKCNGITDRSSDIVTIDSQIAVGVEGIVLSSFSPTAMTGYDFHNVAVYKGPTSYEDNEMCGMGTKSLFVNYGSSMELSGGSATEKYQIVSLCRFNQGQYGGPWRNNRYSNTYQACSDFINNETYNSTSQSIKVFGGDIYVNYYTTPLVFFHWKESYGVDGAEPSGLGANYDPAAMTQLALALAFPTESTVNTDLRHGEYWNKDQVHVYSDDYNWSGTNINNNTNFARFSSDDYLYNDIFSQENTTKTYSSKPFNFIDIEEQPYWVWVSRKKITNEDIDNWRIYNSNDPTTLEGYYGPINRIINYKENIITYQEKGICHISTEERTTIPNNNGAVLEAGTGQILARYDYISKDVGTLHQYSVVNSPNSVYHYDSRLDKFFQIKPGEGGLLSLSDVKGLSAFFRTVVKGDIKESEQILLGEGIHGVYDSKYNKTYFTFLNAINFNYETLTTPTAPDTVYTLTNYSPLYLHEILSIGNTFRILDNIYRVVYIDQTVLQFEIVSGSFSSDTRNSKLRVDFTISYNEYIQAFESFYSFHPNLYISSGERLLSTNPFDTNNSVYEHYTGDYGKYYDQDPSTSQIEFIVNLPDNTKVPTFRLDNLEFWTEVFDSNGLDIPLETVSDIIVYTDYQTTSTSLLNLVPQLNVIRKERTWRVNQLFDYTDPTLRIKPYFRNKYVKVKLMFNNENNREIKIHEVSSNITLSYY